MEETVSGWPEMEDNMIYEHNVYLNHLRIMNFELYKSEGSRLARALSLYSM